MACGRYLPTLKAHKGWTSSDAEDLGDLTGECEACGTEIRYAHTLTHPEHHSITVGCICAGNLTQDYVNPAAREKELRAKAGRKTREKKKYGNYYERKWHPLPPQHEGQWTQANYFIVKVKKWRDKWLVVFKHIVTGQEVCHYPKADTLPAAAHKGLDYLESFDWQLAVSRYK